MPVFTLKMFYSGIMIFQRESCTVLILASFWKICLCDPEARHFKGDVSRPKFGLFSAGNIFSNDSIKHGMVPVFIKKNLHNIPITYSVVV